MTSKEQIIKLATTTQLSNREIADEVGCSRRHVRRVKQAHYSDPESVANYPETPPRVLILDIETAPMEIYSWRIGSKIYADYDNMIKDWSILSWSAKWLNEPTMMGEVVTTKEAENRSDRSIIGGIWGLLDVADIVIAHNGDRFDIRKLNARFIQNELTPPTSYQTVDTLKVAWKHFAFTSNNLNDLADQLNLERRKIYTTFGLWKKCVTGDAKSLEKMLEYNKQDVLLLEDVYMALRPWIKSHPNLAVYVENDEPVCPTCGSVELQWRGYYYTPANRFRAFYCKECGAIGRSRFSDMTKAEKKVLCRSTAR